MRNYYFSEKTAARLMNSVLKGATRDFLKKSWIDSAGRHCACDGFRAYRLNVPVPGVPDQDAAQGIDLNRVFPAFIDESKELDLPPLADLRAMIQEDRRAKPKRGETISTLAGSNIYTFGLSDTGAQLPAVNLKYLADFMLLFPDARAFYTDPAHPIIFRSQDGDGLLMPVRAENARIRRQPPAAAQEDKTPAIGLHTFAALYA